MIGHAVPALLKYHKSDITWHSILTLYLQVQGFSDDILIPLIVGLSSSLTSISSFGAGNDYGLWMGSFRLGTALKKYVHYGRWHTHFIFEPRLVQLKHCHGRTGDMVFICCKRDGRIIRILVKDVEDIVNFC